ncbi:SMP-30/gluconolactonase/LRE family protein [Aeromicrobium sp. UC242_57]|uniref:SMP-30/gluconolactonase/LRE family protein n=1 Tax=Aeromicrobium sp. UC242_57 TaxID=3374624 RepID=UPI0037A5ED43
MTKPSLDPARWTPPAPAPSGQPTAPRGLRVYDTSGYGTEDVLLRSDGQVITGVEDGRLLAIDPETGAETVMATTHGRPLGIEHHPDGGYVVCDSTHGLLRLDADGTLTVLADGFDGAPFRFCNNAAVAADGTIYFTDSSTKFGFEHWRGDLIEHRPTGRLFRRDPDGTLTLLLDHLAFANGVALAADESFVIVAETAGYALQRLWLTGDKAGTAEPFVAVLPGFPDNISTGEDGNIWVTIASPRDEILDKLLPKAPWIRKIVWSLPERFQPQAKKLINIHAYAPDGTLVHDIAGEHDRFGKATGVRQVGGKVWLGSFEQSTIAVLDVP